MHPRLEEVCETLPAAIGRRVLASSRLSSWLRPLFGKGRHVETSGVRWFILLALLAGMRRWRRGTLRYRTEQERSEEHTSELQSLMRISYAVFCLKKNKQ